LLDEPLVHLDSAMREALFGALGTQNFHALLTGTDVEPFGTLAAAYYRVQEGRIEPA
jgi:recombinational DNA repair ATPase RecF